MTEHTSDQTPTTPVRLEDRVAIVTGGASGIGRATCLALARDGARVIAVDMNRERLDETLRSLDDAGAGRRHFALTLDVRREEDMEAMAQKAIEEFGRIDILVASAGVLRGRGSFPKPLARVSTEEWDQVLDTNLKGMFLSNRAVLPAMMKERSGNIVNVSSVSGKRGRAHDAPYCASKSGVIGMTESLTEEVRGIGIRVQLVIPDAVDTPLWDQNGPVPPPPDALAPDRVADLILYLISLPSDTVILGPIIAPFGSSRKRARKRKDEVDTGEES